MVAAVLSYSKGGYQEGSSISWTPISNWPRARASAGRMMFGADNYFLAARWQAVRNQSLDGCNSAAIILGSMSRCNRQAFRAHPRLTPARSRAASMRDGKCNPLGQEIDAAIQAGEHPRREAAKEPSGYRERRNGNYYWAQGATMMIEPKRRGSRGSAPTAMTSGLLLLDVITAWSERCRAGCCRGTNGGDQETISETYFAWSGPDRRGRGLANEFRDRPLAIEYTAAGWDPIHSYGGSQSQG